MILPQAIKRMGPAFTNRAIEIVKSTAIASIIACFELLHFARVIPAAHFNPIQACTVVALIFIVIMLPLTFGARQIEKRFAISD